MSVPDNDGVDIVFSLKVRAGVSTKEVLEALAPVSDYFGVEPSPHASSTGILFEEIEGWCEVAKFNRKSRWLRVGLWIDDYKPGEGPIKPFIQPINELVANLCKITSQSGNVICNDAKGSNNDQNKYITRVFPFGASYEDIEEQKRKNLAWEAECSDVGE